MKGLRAMVLTPLALLSMSVALAQPAGGKGAGPGPGPMAASPAASAPGMGTGPGIGRGAGRWGPDVTPGWALMTQQERNAHRDRMRAMTTYEACKAYQDRHHASMAARAQERGQTLTPAPRHDPCAGLPK